MEDIILILPLNKNQCMQEIVPQTSECAATNISGRPRKVAPFQNSSTKKLSLKCLSLTSKSSPKSSNNSLNRLLNCLLKNSLMLFKRQFHSVFTRAKQMSPLLILRIVHPLNICLLNKSLLSNLILKKFETEPLFCIVLRTGSMC